MSEPWKDYAPQAAPAGEEGPWSDYQPGRPMTPAALKPKSIGLGLRAGVTRPILNGARWIERGMSAAGVDPVKADHAFGFKTADELTQDNERAIAASPHRPAGSGVMAGNIFAAAPLMLATRNPTLLGGGQGAMLSDKDTLGGVAMDAAGGAATGWAGGKMVDAAADVIRPVIEPSVRRLSDAGVKLTPGMIKGEKAMVREDKAMSRPVVGDAIAAGRQRTQDTFNTASVNKALEPLGVKVPTPVKPGHDSIAYAKKQIGDAYDLVIPNLSVNLNGQQFAQAVAPKAAILQPDQRKEFQRLLTLNLGKGQLQGQAIKDAQESLRKLASDYMRADDPAKRHLGEALFAADDELTSAMIAQNPKWAPQLQKVNQAYRGYRIVADAASRADDGVINTNQLRQSVRRGDRSKSKDATARGDAYMQDFSKDARRVIPSRTPDSGTAGRLNAANIFAAGKGGLEAAGYAADNIFQNFRLAPRPSAAGPAAETLRLLKLPAAAGLTTFLEPTGN